MLSPQEFKKKFRNLSNGDLRTVAFANPLLARDARLELNRRAFELADQFEHQDEELVRQRCLDGDWLTRHIAFEYLYKKRKGILWTAEEWGFTWWQPGPQGTEAI